MRAVVLEKTGSAKLLKTKMIPRPENIDEEQVIVKMAYAGINYADILSRKGMYSWAPKRPFTLGLEGTGVIVEKGEKVEGYEIGDRVIVGTQSGTYAEYVKVHYSRVFPAFPNYSLKENAAVAGSYMTAMVALREMGRVRGGETILVQAAAGALGMSTCQLAKAMGLKVAGTASRAEKIDFLREKIGIDLAINYTTQDFVQEIRKWTGGKGVNVVLESVGGKVFQDSLRVLAPTGRIVLVGATSISYSKKNPLSLFRAWRQIPRVNLLKAIRRSYGVLGFHLGWLLTNSREILTPIIEDLQKIMVEHDIHPMIDTVYPLELASNAHQRIESRRNIGKVILAIDESVGS